MYYRNSCSPYDVQANNGGRFTFDTVKERYETTTPLRGKRKEENIRPIKRRDRAWERIIKVNDNEYYVSYDCYRHRQAHNKAITFKADDTMEWITIHTPRRVWQADQALNVRAFSSSSTYWFYDFNLPPEFSMANHRANKYVRYADKFYTIEKGDITFQRKRGGSPTDWQPLVIHREFKHTLDRKKTKELRELLKPFKEYYEVMSDIVEPKYEYGNLIVRAIHNGENGKTMPEQALELFKPSGEPHDAWLKITENLKRKATYHIWDYNTRTHEYTHNKARAIKYLEQDLFQIVKPCKEVAVELGKLSNDRYKWWFA